MPDEGGGCGKPGRQPPATCTRQAYRARSDVRIRGSRVAGRRPMGKVSTRAEEAGWRIGAFGRYAACGNGGEAFELATRSDRELTMRA